jgi:hypothetical protein
MNRSAALLLYVIALLSEPPDRLAGIEQIWKPCGVPQIGFFGDVTTVIGNGAKTIYYRSGTGPWATNPMTFNATHALARLSNGHWLIVDTDNHRLVQLPDLAGTGSPIVRSEMAGVTPKRPHDVIVDPSGYAYVIDGNRRLYRFKDLTGQIDVWTFTPDELGYARSLSWFDDRLHVINSSRGEVLRIDDYTQRRFTTFRSPRPETLIGLEAKGADPAPPHKDFDGGALAHTGLVLNDVDKHGPWYYGTNYFAPNYALGGDTRPARLIRWRTWDDFAHGRWQDLSARIPEDETPLIPYYITIREGILYASVSPATDAACTKTRILRLDLDRLPD